MGLTLKPLAFNATLHNGAALSNSSLLDDRLDTRWPTDFGICLRIAGGWFE